MLPWWTRFVALANNLVSDEPMPSWPWEKPRIPSKGPSSAQTFRMYSKVWGHPSSVARPVDHCKSSLGSELLRFNGLEVFGRPQLILDNLNFLTCQGRLEFLEFPCDDDQPEYQHLCERWKTQLQWWNNSWVFICQIINQLICPSNDYIPPRVQQWMSIFGLSIGLEYPVKGSGKHKLLIMAPWLTPPRSMADMVTHRLAQACHYTDDSDVCLILAAMHIAILKYISLYKWLWYHLQYLTVWYNLWC